MKEELKQEFENKFIEVKYVDENDPGYWDWKNIHFLDILKWIDENFDAKCSVGTAQNMLDALVIKKNADGLLPCPFCGGDAEILPTGTTEPRWFTVQCKECFAEPPEDMATKEEIVMYWNKRV